MEPVEVLIHNYRQGAEMTGDPNPVSANAGHDRLHSSYKQLQASSSGRAAIEQLMDDNDPHVRLWAAAHGLTWGAGRARDVLLCLAKSNGPGSFDAEMTLEEFDKGTLSFEY